MTPKELDEMRQGVLARMERADTRARMAIIAAAMLEAGLLAFAILYMDWKDQVQVELLVFSVMGYTIIVLGLVALANHVTRTVGRVLAALEPK